MSTRIRWRSVVVQSGACAAVALVWWLTALEDTDWALWHRYSANTVIVNVGLSAIVFAAAYLLSAANDLAQRAGHLALLGFSLVLVFGVLELPALILSHDYGATFGTRENDTWLQLSMGVNTRDEELIHLHKGHTRYQGLVHGNLKRLGIPTKLYQVDVAYDRNGFRNNQDFTRADVVALGDSFVEGAEVPQAQTLVARLHEELDADVVNLGQSNYGPQQELIVLQRYGVPLRPKVVLWFFFGGNDLANTETYEWQRSHLDEFLAPPSLSARSFTRNALRALATLTTPERRSASPSGRRHAAEFTRRDGTKETIYLDGPEEPWPPRQWDLASKTLAGAHDLTQKMGSDFIVVYIPRKLRVYRGFLHAEPGAHALTWKDSDLPEVMSAWCREQGIAFLDSTTALRSAVASGESVHLPDDVHWSPAGHRVVAAAVAERVRQMGSLTRTKQDGAE